ncbi:MAG: hypothetical protein HGA24_05455 [Candidatus Aminicenantes bacterium]|nr:hypothetical protein [Candidatus Aminicenantes bacterium]
MDAAAARKISIAAEAALVVFMRFVSLLSKGAIPISYIGIQAAIPDTGMAAENETFPSGRTDRPGQVV